MNDETTPTPPEASVEGGLAAIATDMKESLRHQVACCERKIREQPLKAMGVALAAGYCMHRLPIRLILVTKIRVLAALAPPALLAIGAAKLCETLQCKGSSRQP